MKRELHVNVINIMTVPKRVHIILFYPVRVVSSDNRDTDTAATAALSPAQEAELRPGEAGSSSSSSSSSSSLPVSGDTPDIDRRSREVSDESEDSNSE